MSRRNIKSIQGISGTPPNRTYNFQYGYGTLTLNNCTKWQSGKKNKKQKQNKKHTYRPAARPKARERKKGVKDTHTHARTHARTQTLTRTHAHTQVASGAEGRKPQLRFNSYSQYDSSQYLFDYNYIFVSPTLVTLIPVEKMDTEFSEYFQAMKHLFSHPETALCIVDIQCHFLGVIKTINFTGSKRING